MSNSRFASVLFALFCMSCSFQEQANTFDINTNKTDLESASTNTDVRSDTINPHQAIQLIDNTVEGNTHKTNLNSISTVVDIKSDTINHYQAIRLWDESLGIIQANGIYCFSFGFSACDESPEVVIEIIKKPKRKKPGEIRAYLKNAGLCEQLLEGDVCLNIKTALNFKEDYRIQVNKQNQTLEVYLQY